MEQIKKYFIVAGFGLCAQGALAHVDFDISMQTAQYKDISSNSYNVMMLDFFRLLYNKHSPDVVRSRFDLKIPKIIHQIWLGSKLPAEYEQYRKSWLDNHPNWIFIFWTDNPINYNQGTVLSDFNELTDFLNHPQSSIKHIVIDVKNVNFDNKCFYDEAINYGEKSDILKWEVVYRFGGTYVDTDFECLKPLDDLHYAYDFYTGIQPLDTHMVQLGAALYAAHPGHRVMKACVEKIKDNQDVKQIVVKTGPIHFTRMFFAFADKQGSIDVALPASFLYPCGYDQRGMPAIIWQRPESYAIHHWAGSWLKPEGFVKH
jgi:mannosyltransferase OCH1-like enzyme